MSKIDRDLAHEADLRGRFHRARCPDPKCMVCGDERIWRLVFAPPGHLSWAPKTRQ
jgi:hypothetical protein